MNNLADELTAVLGENGIEDSDKLETVRTLIHNNSRRYTPEENKQILRDLFIRAGIDPDAPPKPVVVRVSVDQITEIVSTALREHLPADQPLWVNSGSDETARGFDPNDDLLTLKEAREFAKIKRTTMWKWVDQEGLRTVTVHGIKRVRRGDLLEFLWLHQSGKTRKRSK